MGSCCAIHKRRDSAHPIVGQSLHKYLSKQLAQIRLKPNLWDIIQKANFDSQDFKFAKSMQETMTDSKGEYLLPHRVARLILQFKRFIYLSVLWEELRASIEQNSQSQSKASPLSFEHSLLPSPLVDRVWQILLSNTSCYRKFCASLIDDRILPRISSLKPKIAHYSLTIHLYIQKFGKPDPQFWPEYVTSEELMAGYSGFCCFPTKDFLAFRENIELEKRENTSLKQFQSLLYDLVDVMKTKNAYVQIENLEKEPMLQINPPMIFDQDVQLLVSDGKCRTPRALEQINEELSTEKIEIVISAPPSLHIATEESARDYNFNLSGLDEHVANSNRNLRKDDRTPSPNQDRLTRQTYRSGGAQLPSADQSDLQEEPSGMHPNFSLSSVESCPVQEQATPSKTINSYYCDSTLTIGTIELDTERLETKIKNHSGIYKKLQSYEIPDSILFRFSGDFNSSPSFTLHLFNEYKRYLFILKVSQGIQKIECSQLIRIAWNYHVAYSQEYQQFCSQVFGEFIDTHPLPRLIGLEEKRNYARTMTTFRRVFGDISDGRIWPNVDQCFNQDINFSWKLFNIQGYIDLVIENIKKKRTGEPKKKNLKGEPKWKLIEQSKRALAHMLINTKPERGKFHLKRESKSGNYFDELESYTSLT